MSLNLLPPVMESALALMIYPKGFGCNDLKEKVQQKGYKDYRINNARFDMQKLKGKNFVQTIKGKQRNRATRQGVQNMSEALCVWKKELKPFLTTVNKNEVVENNKELTAIETHFFNARKQIQNTLNLYGIKIAS